MKLETLLKKVKDQYGIDLKTNTPNMDHSVKGITSDSRMVQKGFIFVAIEGSVSDGNDYINDAIKKGAICIIGEKKFAQPSNDIVVIQVDDARKTLAYLSSVYFDPQPEHIMAVTGTNGKTSNVRFFQRLLNLLDKNSASLGTLGVQSYGHGLHSQERSQLTTPGAPELHRQLFDLKEAGIEFVGLEASSHGLEQKRLDGVKIKVAVFSNLSQDHLDYHHSMKNYFHAKSRLFSELLLPTGTAIINIDDEKGLEISKICKNRSISILSIGKSKEADLRINSLNVTSNGQNCEFSFKNETYSFNTPLVGEFQIYNLLTSLLAVYSILDESKPLKEVVELLPKIEGVKGRLQNVATLSNLAKIYVDYAHTPDALEKVLRSLRIHCSGQLHVVFGCGGNRDKEKRPLMGEVASRLADKVYVTDDNPRTEDPNSIRKEILSAIDEVIEIPDRKQAIWKSVGNLKANDILLIAGKGHEPGQIIGKEIIPFDDSIEAKNAAKYFEEKIVS